MSEYPLQFMAFSKILWISVGSLFYGMGGIERKWLRRFVLPFWMGIGILVFASLSGSLSLLYFLYPLFLCVSLHMGYGANSIGEKLRKRALYGFSLGISALPFCLSSHMWLLFAVHVALCVASSVILGVFNPVKAREEETLIAVLSTVLVFFLI